MIKIVLIGLITLGLIISLIMYLIILGGNKNKTDEEKQIEDKEQMDYLKNKLSERWGR